MHRAVNMGNRQTDSPVNVNIINNPRSLFLEETVSNRERHFVSEAKRISVISIYQLLQREPISALK